MSGLRSSLRFLTTREGPDALKCTHLIAHTFSTLEKSGESNVRCIQRSLKLGFRFVLLCCPTGRLSSHPKKLECFDRMNTGSCASQLEAAIAQEKSPWRQVL